MQGVFFPFDHWNAHSNIGNQEQIIPFDHKRRWWRQPGSHSLCTVWAICALHSILICFHYVQRTVWGSRIRDNRYEIPAIIFLENSITVIKSCLRLRCVHSRKVTVSYRLQTVLNFYCSLSINIWSLKQVTWPVGFAQICTSSKTIFKFHFYFCSLLQDH